MKSSQRPKPGSPLRLAAPDEALPVTWLELFFDLVFAAAFGALGALLIEHLTFSGVLVFLALFQAVTWVWTNYTMFTSRFETNDFVHRLLSAALILTTLVMVVQTPQVIETSGAGFIVAYLAARVLLIILHARPHWHLPAASNVHRVYFIGSGLAMACWALSLFLPPPARFALWGLGIAIDFAFPLFDRRALERFPVNPSHLPERLGLFVMIVLGESILAVVHGLGHVGWGSEVAAAAALASVLAVCVWWAYFSFMELADHECTLGTGVPYLYAHMPLLAGLTVLAAGLGKMIPEALEPRLPGSTLALLGTGLVSWVLSFLVVQKIAETRRLSSPFQAAYVTIAGAMGLVAAVGGQLPPLSIMVAFVSGMVVLLLLEMRFCRHEIRMIMERDVRTDNIARISVDDLAARLSRGEPVVIVDVRRNPDDAQIPGSLRFDPDELLGATSISLPYDRDRLIATYCT